ncbi:hypothetical protein HYH03_001879 [Edaphochlamys debaryana]|uniref:PsbP C-terminal domain-containing protein n=1 Tax=Edaphochlamys debaryana TaxID=47281 RepID=A0A835YG46_9CHLO|nr:hypothetical protein HYH03_001879 [Edaphochlamys debaryana]|eukprot:KAG2500301.1 hypothetical protein HYH03_001879 [Edaphochlamys debaryana]
MPQRSAEPADQPAASAPQAGRRTVLHSFAAPLFLAALTYGSDDPTTILNSVLAGYGLPKLPGSSGYKALDDFEQDFTLEYPRGWVVRPNSLRGGVYISDYNTADKLTVEVQALDPGADLVEAAVTAAVVPGASSGQQRDKLLPPPLSKVKSRTAELDGREYTYLEFSSDTITRSGYNVRRRNFAAACVKKGTLFVINASARSDQYDTAKEEVLRHVVESFRVR